MMFRFFGLNISIHISIYSDKQIYILQYNHDGIQKEVMRLIRICFPLNKMVNSLKLYPVRINKNIVERDTEKILHLMIQAWNFHHIFITSHAFKSDSWPLQIRPFSRWPPKNKMADISLGSVCGKLVISRFLVIVEQQNWYQIKATALSVSIKFKWSKLTCIFVYLWILTSSNFMAKKSVKYI